MSNLKRSHTTTKLEVENRKMEERLRVLKEMMSAEKSRRELDGGIYWQSGQSGPLQLTNKQPVTSNSRKCLPNDKSKKPMKVRVLTDKIISAQSSNQKSHLPRCGQCERSSASLNCVECIENYCQLCFTKIHQKGGLAKHHVKPILHKVRPVSPPKKTSNVPTKEPSPSEGVDDQNNSGSLLEGTYDEASSAKSFQEALAEWRGGRGGTSVKESNTHTVKDSSVGMTSEVATMTGTAQTDAISSDSKAKQAVNIEFSDKNRVTYFEKMLVRKYKDGTMVKSHSSGVVECTELQDEEEDESVHAISQYNIFYDAEPVENGVIETESSFDDFSDCKPPSGAVSIEELSSCKENSTPVTESRVICESEGKKISTEDCKQAEKSVVSNSSKTVDTKLNSKGGNRRSKKVQAKKKRSETSSDIQHCKQSELLSSSVKSAWADSVRSDHDHRQMMHFFLHGVGSSMDEQINVYPPSISEPPNEKSPLSLSQFKLESTIWLPNSSIHQTEPEIANNDAEQATTMPRSNSVSRPGTRECKDHYYDDTDSDSEPENEREAFIGSNTRPGTSRDTECVQSSSRPTSSTCRDLEEEEIVERDRADCEALDDLAWELASTAEYEGRLTRCKGDLDQLDLEADVDRDLATPMHTNLGEEVDGVDVGEVDMSKVISEFEIYQRELMEEDYEEEQ